MQMPKIRDWHHPEKDYEDIYAFRNWNLSRLRAGGQEAWDAAWAYYAANPCDAIEHWVTTYDPRKVPLGLDPFVPFVLFDRQKECIHWLLEMYHSRKEGIIEKSRDCGVSWITLSFAWWLWTFHSGVQAGFGSRTENSVDRIGDPDSLFQKVRILIARLPVELRPIGWRPVDDQPHMRIKNRETGSALIGQGGRNIGRGGRSSIYFVDEAAFLDYPEDAVSALSANADCKIWLSTPNGAGNPFYRMRFSGNFPVFTFHWREDPRKGDEWYAIQKKKLDPQTLAQEVDLDYEASDSRVTIPAIHVRASRALRALLEEDGLLPKPVKGGGIAGLDVGGGGAGKSVLAPRHGPVAYPTKEWGDDDTTDVSGKAREAALDADCWILKFDSIGIGRGVASALRRMSGIKVQGVNVGDRPTRTMWPDQKRASRKFVNLKAELWWVARDALRRTYEHWLHYTGEGGTAHDLADLLLLPDDDALCAELSLPRYFFTEAGKIQMESKRQLASRGVASPDHADALILTYAPHVRHRGTTRARARW